MTRIPRPPAIPASIGALVMLAGLGLIYFSLSGLGLIRSSDSGTVGTGNASGSVVGKLAPVKAGGTAQEGTGSHGG